MARRPGGRRRFRPSRAPLRILVCAIGIAVITLTTGDLNQFPPVQSSAASPPSSSVVLARGEPTAPASMQRAPFEQGPRFDVDDVLARYQTAIGVSGALVLMVVALLVALVAVYRRQAVLKDRFSRHEQRWLNQFRDFCENVPGMLFQYRQGPDGTVSFPFASPRIVETHGCSADEVAEDASVMFDLIEPADRLELSDALETSRQGLTPFDANYRVNHPVYGRRWMRGRATPSKDDDGGVTWHGYVQDVTDLKAF